jgi:DNA polymerase III sliding clamp (beta) subunit (PCNA family)
MVHIENGRMTACDGVRLQQIAFPDLKAEVDIPIGAVSDLVKLLRSADSASIGLAETSTHLVFSIGSDLFLINRLMTQFPDMETNILGPALANTQVLEVSRELLASAIRRVRITADSGSNAVNLVLSMDNIRVEAQDGNGNRCFEDVAASWMMGERTVTVNHRSLSDLLSASTAVVCRFKLGADKGTIKSPLLLVDETTQAYGVLQQMRSSFSGRI